MIGYTTIGVKDLDAAKQFYSELLDSKVLVDVGRLAMIGKSMGCLLYTSPSPRDS